MNNQTTKSKKRSTASISRKLNAALMRRKFAKNILTDILVVVIVVIVWCLSVEAAHGGVLTNVDDRQFAVTEYHTLEARIEQPIYAIFDFFNYGSSFVDRILPFEGFVYQFSVNGEGYEVDCSVVFTVIAAVFLVAIVVQFIAFIIGHFTGRGMIQKYLRPIDDIAIMAEKISSEGERHTANYSEIRQSARQSYTDDTDISSAELEKLENAIDNIDDSTKRIEVHESELSGLEAAVNNMLRRLEESKMKQIRFVDDASHELRTPISVIQGYVNMLDRWGKDDPQVRDEAIEALLAESEHMKTLIDQLLFLARGEMDRLSLNREDIDVCELVDEILEESIMIDEKHDYSITSLPDSDDGIPPKINADPALIKQSIRILRDNAAKYTEAGGAISFKVYEKSVAGSGKNPQNVNKICIEVSDSGIGIPPKELPRIFDRFYRGENARGNSVSGSGLGLSIAKWIVEQHGGQIEAVSSVGIGTKMTVILDEAVPSAVK
ncbi:MAG: hypothetical protein E7672_03755 [Ruminococcaceae bacterium]|nr:hypothetical protein [Oscillospiraceae bacterium]